MRGSSEPDVERDDNVVRSRESGGPDPADKPPGPRRADSDAESTTGTEDNQEFVGRTAGQDPGYAGETGAERRAEQGS